MSEQIRKEKQEAAPQSEVEEESLEAKDQTELTEEVDDLLADIDDVLEQNAEEFVKAYVQKGGQ
jgi:ubiquitin-like protein Pup